MESAKADYLGTAAMDHILQTRKIVIMCGTGGVGKTTLSAAVAIRAALLGKKVVVITMDPAKRLAHALGLQTLGDIPTDLTPKLANLLKNWSPPIPFAASIGSLAAIIPDTRKTFENFVRELAPTVELANQVMNNPIFQIFAREFSGTNEYMALERIYGLYRKGQYDCIILDTPPSRNTLAFLNAPGLLDKFFEEKIIRWLVLPANRLLSAGMTKAFGILERLTGASFMSQLFEFASALMSVQVNFRDNLSKITKVLQSEHVGFVMVTTPTLDTVEEVTHFLNSLHQQGFHYDGLLLNRMLGLLKKSTESSDFHDSMAVVEARQQQEKQVLDLLKNRNDTLCGQIPDLARDIHSMEDLFHVALALG